MPKGSTLGKPKTDIPKDKPEVEEEAPDIASEELEPPLQTDKTDPLKNEDGTELGVESQEPPNLALDLEEGNTRGKTTVPKDTKSDQEPETPPLEDPNRQATMAEAKAASGQSKNRKLVDEKQKQFVKEAKSSKESKQSQLDNDFDALIEDMRQGDEAKERRDKSSKKEKEVIKDVLKDNGTGYTEEKLPDDGDTPSEKAKKTSSKPGDPDISPSRSKRQGVYDPIKHGSEAKQRAVQDFAQEQFKAADAKDKFVQAREKHQEAVEAYNKKKEKAAKEKELFEKNKEKFNDVKTKSKDSLALAKKTLKEDEADLAEATQDEDHKRIASAKKRIKDSEKTIAKEEQTLARLKDKAPKPPQKFTEKEPKFTEKEPKEAEMRKPQNEMEHMQWQDHVRGADKLAQKVTEKLKDPNLSPSQKKRLESIHEELSYHSGMTNFPTNEQKQNLSKLENMTKESGVDPKEPLEKEKNTKPITLPSGIGARLGRVGTTVEAAGDIPAIISDYGIGGLSKLANKLLNSDDTKPEEEEEVGNSAAAESDNSSAVGSDAPPAPQKREATQVPQPSGIPSLAQEGSALGSIPNPGKQGQDIRPRTPEELEGKDRPEPNLPEKGKFLRTDEGSKDSPPLDKKKVKLRTPEELDKSMFLYLDLSKGISSRPNVSVDSDKTKERQDSQYNNSFERRTSGVMGGSAAPDKKEVGKEWKSLDKEEEDIVEKLEKTAKSINKMLSPYSTEKTFLNNMGYTDEDILYGRVVLKSKDLDNYKDFLIDNVKDSLNSLKKAL